LLVRFFFRFSFAKSFHFVRIFKFRQSRVTQIRRYLSPQPFHVRSHLLNIESPAEQFNRRLFLSVYFASGFKYDNRPSSSHLFLRPKNPFVFLSHSHHQLQFGGCSAVWLDMPDTHSQTHRHTSPAALLLISPNNFVASGRHFRTPFTRQRPSFRTIFTSTLSSSFLLVNFTSGRSLSLSLSLSHLARQTCCAATQHVLVDRTLSFSLIYFAEFTLLDKHFRL
jgi:hypothetical protein